MAGLIGEPATRCSLLLSMLNLVEHLRDEDRVDHHDDHHDRLAHVPEAQAQGVDEDHEHKAGHCSAQEKQPRVQALTASTQSNKMTRAEI